MVVALALVGCTSRAPGPSYPVRPATATCWVAPCSVRIIGDVNAPGEIAYRPGMTLLDVLQEVGGVGPMGDRRRIKLLRGGATYMVNLDKILDGRAPMPELAPGDVVHVGFRPC